MALELASLLLVPSSGFFPCDNIAGSEYEKVWARRFL